MARGAKKFRPGTQPRTRVKVCMHREPRKEQKGARYVSSRPLRETPSGENVKKIIVSRKCLSLAEKTGRVARGFLLILSLSHLATPFPLLLAFVSPSCVPPLLSGSVGRTGTTFTVRHGKRHWEETEGDSPPAEFMVRTGETVK